MGKLRKAGKQEPEKMLEEPVEAVDDLFKEEVVEPVLEKKVKAPKKLVMEDLTSEEEEVEKDEADYLQKYQYKKSAEFGSKKSNPQPGSKAEKMKMELLSQPKVRIVITRKPQEDKGIRASVTLNGYRLDFPKQVYLDVPEQVAKVIMDSQQQTEFALERNKIDTGSAKGKALGL